MTAQEAVVAAVGMAQASAPVWGPEAVVVVWRRVAVFPGQTRAKGRSEVLLETCPDRVRILQFDFELPFFLLRWPLSDFRGAPTRVPVSTV